MVGRKQKLLEFHLIKNPSGILSTTANRGYSSTIRSLNPTENRFTKSSYVNPRVIDWCLIRFIASLRTGHWPEWTNTELMSSLEAMRGRYLNRAFRSLNVFQLR